KELYETTQQLLSTLNDKVKNADKALYNTIDGKKIEESIKSVDKTIDEYSTKLEANIVKGVKGSQDYVYAVSQSIRDGSFFQPSQDDIFSLDGNDTSAIAQRSEQFFDHVVDTTTKNTKEIVAGAQGMLSEDLRESLEKKVSET